MNNTVHELQAFIDAELTALREDNQRLRAQSLAIGHESIEMRTENNALRNENQRLKHQFDIAEKSFGKNKFQSSLLEELEKRKTELEDQLTVIALIT